MLLLEIVAPYPADLVKLALIFENPCNVCVETGFPVWDNVTALTVGFTSACTVAVAFLDTALPIQLPPLPLLVATLKVKDLVVDLLILFKRVFTSLAVNERVALPSLEILSHFLTVVLPSLNLISCLNPDDFLSIV